MAGQCFDGEVVWMPILNAEKVLCLKVVPDSPLLSTAAHVLDTCMQLETTRSRMEATETDVTAQVLAVLRHAGKWPAETCASMIELDDTRAVGMGSNIKHRRRAAWLALALAYVVSAGHRRHVSNEHLTQTVTSCGLASLATEAWNTKRMPLSYPSVEDAAPTVATRDVRGSAVPAAGFSAPAPRAPPSSSSELQIRARQLGADETVVNDPFMTVDETLGSVLCAACGKHFTPEHGMNRRHLNYRRNVRETLMWVRNERKTCLGILQAQEENQVTQTTAVPMPRPGPTMAAATQHDSDSVWGDDFEVTGATHVPAQTEPVNSWEDLAVPDTPTLEETYDFAMQLYSNFRPNAGLRKHSFKDPLGVEEV
ncbi:act1 [Symbiodinium necroappetens]|uniref:Act1 protein n=1 Tax=Symbiodinium necroappetens TaxID=1628268 RepID=A0A813ADZ3_9DINO|nr:act1 [Symbiodinium necroappetens]